MNRTERSSQNYGCVMTLLVMTLVMGLGLLGATLLTHRRFDQMGVKSEFTPNMASVPQFSRMPRELRTAQIMGEARSGRVH
jgi:hypothetical protein